MRHSGSTWVPAENVRVIRAEHSRLLYSQHPSRADPTVGLAEPLCETLYLPSFPKFRRKDVPSRSVLRNTLRGNRASELF